MKKLILAIAVVSITLASCSNNEIDRVVNTNGNNPISFTNLNDKVTRSANDNQSNYRVYAKSTLAGETEWFINNEEIKNADNKPLSDKVYYWPSAPETVDFYAWAPATVTATSSTRPNLSINYTVPQTANEDFTVATPQKGKSSTDVTVAFKFSHMLTKISVSAQLTQALTDAGYSMIFTSASLTVNSSGGTLSPTADTPAWTSTENSTSATYTGKKSYMVMPQTSTGCIVKLMDVTITKGGATVFSGNMKAYAIAAGNVTGNAFVKGSHYNLTLTIDNSAHDDGGAGGSGTEKPVFGNEIKFSADLAADWKTDGTDTSLDQQ